MQFQTLKKIQAGTQISYLRFRVQRQPHLTLGQVRRSLEVVKVQ